MKIRITIMLLLWCAVTTAVYAHGKSEADSANTDGYTGSIYLYGEQHGVKKITDKELELWHTYYTNGMRHLFLELPSYTAEYLTIWLKEKDNAILDEVFSDWKGTAFHNQHTFNFFMQIKAQCPETVFHGTDVGHQYSTTGERFLRYLESKKQQNSPAYLRAQEIIQQGITYYTGSNTNAMAYRENMMVQNFIYELNHVQNADIMGIYGSAHTDTAALDSTGTIPCMANQLKSIYGDNLNTEDLTPLAKDIEPIRIDTITAAHTDYRAYYYGKQDLNGFKGFLYREFWQLDSAYEALKDSGKTGDWLPESNYPMQIEPGQVYVIDYTKADNTKIRLYYISEGKIRNGQLITENIAVE
ncbi:MAG: hypothetical protein ACTTH7_10000 [Treponema sp.]